jgi:hypothetical protein
VSSGCSLGVASRSAACDTAANEMLSILRASTDQPAAGPSSSRRSPRTRVTELPKGRPHLRIRGSEQYDYRLPPTAAARCAGPLSFPTNTEHLERPASNAPKGNRPVASRVPGALSTRIRPARARSGLPPTSTERSPLRRSRRVKAAKRSSGQHFWSRPPPGCKQANGSPGVSAAERANSCHRLLILRGGQELGQPRGNVDLCPVRHP